MASQTETPVCSCTRRTTSHQFIWQQHKSGVLGGSPMEGEVIGQHYETPYFHPRHRHPSSWNDPSENNAGST